MILRFMLLLCLAPSALFTPAVASPREGRDPARPLLRIGLLRQYAHPPAVLIAAPAGARLLDANGRLCAAGPGEWRLAATEGRVTTEGTGGDGKQASSFEMLRIETPTDGAPLGVCLPDTSSASRPAARVYTRFRGALEVAALKTGGLRLVNVVDLESYLRGVVPSEMPPFAPPEALRAQAVCARTYALRSRGRFRAEGYDLTDTTASQVYGGVNAERAATDTAVRDTEGMVLARGEALLVADYYDDCGGVTSAGERDGDYPPSVVDAPAPGGAEYCAKGRYHAWTLALDAGEMTRRMQAARPRVGAVREIEVTETDESGRARRLAIVGDAGRREMRGYAFRALLGYDRLRSTLFTVQRAEDGRFVFQGRGYGHGHGLCQTGAIGMASPPYNRSYRDILNHYFPGAQVIRW